MTSTVSSIHIRNMNDRENDGPRALGNAWGLTDARPVHREMAPAAANDFPATFDLEYPFGWQALILKDWSDKTTPAATSYVSALSDPDLW